MLPHGVAPQHSKRPDDVHFVSLLPDAHCSAGCMTQLSHVVSLMLLFLMYSDGRLIVYDSWSCVSGRRDAGSGSLSAGGTVARQGRPHIGTHVSVLHAWTSCTEDIQKTHMRSETWSDLQWSAWFRRKRYSSAALRPDGVVASAADPCTSM
jgi:hypothetical protein